MERNYQAHLAVLSANLIYGANYSIAKLVMPEFIKPFGVIFIRVIFSAIIFFIIGSFKHDERMPFTDLVRLFFCAVFGIAVNQLLFFKGLDLTSPINAALMMTTNPIMVLIVAAIIIKDKITTSKITGVILGIAGAATLVLWGNTFTLNTGSSLGDFYVLVNSLSFGVFLILVKPLMQKYTTLTVMKWIFLFGSFMVFPFGYSEFNEINWNSFTVNTWLAVAFVVIATTTLAYLLNTYALKQLSPSSVSVYIYLQPLFAAIFAIIVGKDVIGVHHLVCAALIFAGVYFVTRKSPEILNKSQ